MGYDADREAPLWGNRLVSVTGVSGTTMSAHFTYNGDGQKVKSVINGETILLIGGHFEVQNPGSGQTVTKYYFAGASRIATLAPHCVRCSAGVRKYTIPQSMTLEYFLGDHLGSTSITTDNTGAKASEMRYEPCPYRVLREGEIRYAWTSGQSTTPAYKLPVYSFTGQRSYMDDPSTSGMEGFGLMDYNARMYDPQVGRFTSADTVVPGGVQGFDRYAYTFNNPVNYVDPSGHDVCTDDGYCGKLSDIAYQKHIYTEAIEDGFGSSLETESGQHWTLAELKKIYQSLYRVGTRFASVLGGSPQEAFSQVFPNGVTFVKSNQSCEQGTNGKSKTCWGQTVGLRIYVFTNADAANPDYGRFLIHEMGHAFDNQKNNLLSWAYGDRMDRISRYGWTPMPTGCAGFAQPEGDCSDYLEEAADMFLAWVDGSFTTDLAGTRRSNWMHLWMGTLLLGREYPLNFGAGCDEDTGIGCEP